jgi:recombination protein RecA
MISKPFTHLIKATDMHQEPFRAQREKRRDWWTLEELSGRLTELSGNDASAPLTLACTLVLEAQGLNIPVAWISSTPNTFYPPDMAQNGVDLEALPVVWAHDELSCGRASDWLIRSSCFGLIILDLRSDLGLDLGSDGNLPASLQSRLVQLARMHDTALLCLTTKEATLPSMGSMISLRGQALRERIRPFEYICKVQILKDKRRGPGWKHTEVCRGPAGLH